MTLLSSCIALSCLSLFCLSSILSCRRLNLYAKNAPNPAPIKEVINGKTFSIIKVSNIFSRFSTYNKRYLFNIKSNFNYQPNFNSRIEVVSSQNRQVARIVLVYTLIKN